MLEMGGGGELSRKFQYYFLFRPIVEFPHSFGIMKSWVEEVSWRSANS